MKREKKERKKEERKKEERKKEGSTKARKRARKLFSSSSF